jgi:hypothetical protein
MRDVQSSKNELREKRDVGNERTSPHEVEWDCSMVHEQAPRIAV